MKQQLVALGTAVAAVVAVAAPVDAGREETADLGDRSFAVEVTVLQSADPGLPAGTTLPNCYTFAADGTWTDPIFPSPGAPVDGTWEGRAAGRVIGYRAEVDAGVVTLQQHGLVLSSRVHPTRLVARTTVAVEGDPVLRVRSVGTEVDSCDA